MQIDIDCSKSTHSLEIRYITDKAEAIKEINKFRLANKNKWYQVEVEYEGFTYQMKIFNTWAQIARKRFTDSGELVHNYPSPMELKVKEFKEYLNKFIN